MINVKRFKRVFAVVLLVCVLTGTVSGCGNSFAEVETKPADNTVTEVPVESIESKTDTEEAAEPQEEDEAFVIPEVPQIDEHGFSKLYVDGTQLLDTYGEVVQLKGISTHGINWFSQYINQDLFNELADEWNCEIIRLAMYTAEYAGYCDETGDKEALKQIIRDGVEYATNAGMYVIIDWHVNTEHTPLTYMDEAMDFFDEMSKEYASYNNVLYEICNEPNGKTSWDDVAEYANTVIPVIRLNSPDSVILVGTPHWSQYVTMAGKNPLEFDNVMYVLHFYAVTHQDGTRDTLNDAMERGIPVMVTEYATCTSSGNGVLDFESAYKWTDLMDSYNISYMCWNLSNKDESSSLIKPECEKVSGLTDDDLTEQGIWLKYLLRGEPIDIPEEE